ncbi:hypothetical protein DdX_18855 [Ditylenchus destructor]|uniref:Uncharacterized protein n=1 Tax=Ditylenchus destructor TaxID=166010 RepID=A0AAD4QXR9_9BILA|nr:hypothetical protein DdX_18855 [Ditylenchus destructor]
MGLLKHYIALLTFISKWVEKRKRQNKSQEITIETFAQILPSLREEEQKFRKNNASQLHKIWEQNLKANHPSERQKALKGKYHTGGLTHSQPQKKSGVVYEKAIQKKKFIKLELEIHEKRRQIYHEDEPEPSKRIRRIMKEYLELESSEGEEEEKSEGSESDAE